MVLADVRFTTLGRKKRLSADVARVHRPHVRSTLVVRQLCVRREGQRTRLALEAGFGCVLRALMRPNLAMKLR